MSEKPTMKPTEPTDPPAPIAAQASIVVAAPVTAAAETAVPVPEEQQQRNAQVHLRKIPLLADLSDEEIVAVKAELRIRQYAKREVVLHKGGSGDGLLFLLSGQLQVIDVTEDGRAVGLRMLAPGDFFGEIALINGTTRSASVVAMSEVLVAFLPAPLAMRLFSHSPSVAKQMLQHLAQKIQRDSEFRALLSINNTSRRIYTFLVLMQKRLPDGTVVDNLPTHQDIANMINTSRETVTRALLTLVQQGIVQKEPHRLVIKNPEALQKLVQGE
ncbi:Crp/Fnr family transcriptional regulator [Rugamonas rubra]|uniref:Crp-like helix-turn-helix domain-containing protein n=1 Tax=Rugamonas rubra TaxID=758825 RepID=A0A1I4I3B5_9BURK|nr:Crp/Fnr family transcriptional regulator [Rugamonas rubra]SFL48865.1 Crp-like helix-turn-helix domain-containing protein [Rugamonas rubra]